MKKLLIAFSACALLACLLCGCLAPGKSPGSFLGIDLSQAEILSQQDEHGGFHGDGASLRSYRFSPEAVEGLCADLAQREDWFALPVDPVFIQIIGGDSGSASQAMAQAISGVDSGFYCFRDRHSQAAAETPEDPQALAERASYNFTLALYDSESRTLYYYQLDT